MGSLDAPTRARERPGGLDGKEELPDVPGPAPGEERRPGVGGDGRAAERPLEEDPQVPRPLPQRRKDDRDPGDAVEEVGAEAAFPGEPGEVPVRGGDEPQVDGARPRLAESPDLAFLKNAQELRLDLR